MHRQRLMQFHGPSSGVPITHWSFAIAAVQFLGFGDSDSLHSAFSVGADGLFATLFLGHSFEGCWHIWFACILSILL